MLREGKYSGNFEPPACIFWEGEIGYTIEQLNDHWKKEFCKKIRAANETMKREDL